MTIINKNKKRNIRRQEKNNNSNNNSFQILGKHTNHTNICPNLASLSESEAFFCR